MLKMYINPIMPDLDRIENLQDEFKVKNAYTVKKTFKMYNMVM